MLRRLTATCIGLGVVLLAAKPSLLRQAIAPVSTLHTVAIGLAQAQSATSTDRVTKPFRGITHIHRTDTVPRRLSMHIVKINLSDPAIKFELTPSNGEQPGDTRMETTPQFIQRIGAQVGINAGFFSDDISQEGQKHTNVVSLAASKGNRYSPWERPFLFGANISQANQFTLLQGNPDTGTTQPSIPLYNAFAGGGFLVQDGVSLSKPNPDDKPAPRSAIALTADNHLLLFVVDGRKKSHSRGMTYPEMANTLIQFGAVSALSLDGGGSSTLALCPSRGSCSAANRPSDGSPRPVGSNLAVFAAPL